MKKILFLVIICSLTFLQGQEQWFGVIDGEVDKTIGREGMSNANFGMILDLGEATGKITKIEYQCPSNTEGGPNSNISWKLYEIDQEGKWTDNILEEGNVVGHDSSTSPTKWRSANINSTINVSGKVGFVICLADGGFWGRVSSSNYGISYIKMWDWIQLGTSVLLAYKGDIALRCQLTPEFNSIENLSNIPHNVSLKQNYPNPFNPVTTIEYSLTKSEKINISVFNDKGELISNLVNRNVSKGVHKVKFNASNLQSGIYFYKITTPTNNLTKKMILIK